MLPAGHGELAVPAHPTGSPSSGFNPLYNSEHNLIWIGSEFGEFVRSPANPGRKHRRSCPVGAANAGSHLNGWLRPRRWPRSRHSDKIEALRRDRTPRVITDPARGRRRHGLGVWRAEPSTPTAAARREYHRSVAENRLNGCRLIMNTGNPARDQQSRPGQFCRGGGPVRLLARPFERVT